MALKCPKLAKKPCFWAKNEVFGQWQISANTGKVNYLMKYEVKYVNFYDFRQLFPDLPGLDGIDHNIDKGIK